MFQIDPKVTCGVWCALVLCVSGQDAVPNSGDRLEAETAARLREFDKNNNRGGPRRPMSPEMQAISRNPDLLDKLGAEDLAKMSLDDPLLKYAYASVFMHSVGPFKQLEPPLELVLADMRRRGEAVSPMLLKLIWENQENRIEFSILGKIEALDTVSIEPFLEYARRLLRERTQTMTGEAAGVACYILSRHGTKEDEALLEWVSEERPYVASEFTDGLKILRDRLNTQPVSRPERREIPSPNAGKGVGPVEGIEDHPQDGDSTISQTKPWIISGIIFVVLLGVYRFLRQRRKAQKSKSTP
jgi:hypothetical protein